MTKMNKPLALILATALMILAPLSAHSEQGRPPATTANPAAPQMDEAMVDKFVDAFGKVKGLQQIYSAKLESAADEQEAMAIQQQAQQEMMAAVEEAGMSVEEYNQFVSAMNQDQALRERVLDRVK
ncbi:MAG TPA: DUF4168 domain-containing protein [Gammaproteobacteria bacterium]|jgi:hypothetical protein